MAARITGRALRTARTGIASAAAKIAILGILSPIASIDTQFQSGQRGQANRESDNYQPGPSGPEAHPLELSKVQLQH